MDLIIYTFSFIFIALASYLIGELFSRLGLPKITGYLLAGAVAGPFILGLMPSDTGTQLRYIDELSLAVIAFVAGSELYLKEIRSRLKTISFMTTGVVIAGPVLMGVALFFMTEFISFTQGMPLVSRVAVAILGGVILLALSPASTIAVIKDVRARGQYTSTVLGVTVTMDVVVIVLFAIAMAVAGVLMTGASFSIGFVGLLVLDLALAVGLGVLGGLLLRVGLSRPWPYLAKIVLVLAMGYAVFALADIVSNLSHTYLPVEIHLEPILMAMVAGFFVTNFTPNRDMFDDIMHDIGPAVYVAFFTLTGLGLKLDILLSTLPVAVALFVARGGSIFVGSYLGSRLAGESRKHTHYYWLGLITQAGIALGLAREVANVFPELGNAFATLIISVVVLNEMFGPMFLKFALQRVGESQDQRTAVADDEERDAVILGIESQSVALARSLTKLQWHVILADDDESHVTHLATEEIDPVDVRYLNQINDKELRHLITSHTDAVLAMMADDQLNLRICEVAYQQGVKRIIVRPSGLGCLDRFEELGALVIDQTSAMIYLLERAIRTPQTAAMLLHQNATREMVQVTINNEDVDGLLVRDLRLPSDVLLLDVTRDGQSVVPNGYTKLMLKDEVTLVGRGVSLDEVTLRLGY